MINIKNFKDPDYKFNLEIHWSMLIGVILLGIFFGAFGLRKFDQYPIEYRLFYGLVISSLMYFGDFLHELGHTSVAILNGIRVRKIFLGLLYGYTERDNILNRFVSSAGVLANFIYGFILLIIAGLFPYDSVLSYALFFTGLTNIVMGIVNALPVWKFDGVRIFKKY